ncbi:conserved hypothetical protein [Ricinus communis]|uniref:Uncharacterized protein n=1 Tax=Ricinus communis TaxID=3988 RepID=B9T4N7_RICCO|nr:conserved hypothetical protein [Ricinus communis]
MVSGVKGERTSLLFCGDSKGQVIDGSSWSIETPSPAIATVFSDGCEIGGGGYMNAPF